MWTREARKWIVLGICAAVGIALLSVTWAPLTALFADLSALEAWVEQLGPWGPVALVALGVVQVLIAPLPGYPLVFVSGVLYGGWAGAIYANLGMMIAGMLAAWLARRFGRPVVERFVARSHMERIEHLLESDSPWLWFFVLLLPTGDLPYFAAGLSRISMRNYFLVLFAARFPFTFVLTHAAARATELSGQTLLLLSLPLALLVLLAYWQQERITGWMHGKLDQLAHTRRAPETK